MKKYLILSLLFLPMVSMAAPSVRKLGAPVGTSNAAAVKTAVAAKVTPGKAVTPVGTSGTATSVARVGSLHAKSVTPSLSGSTGGTSSRFPVILPTKVYNNSVKAPSAQGGTVINADLSELEGKVEANTNAIEDLRNDPRFDSVKVGKGSAWADRDDGRAWIWIEEGSGS